MPATILVAEPDEGNRHLLQLYLQMGGYRVVTALTANRALTLARSGVDLVTLEHFEEGGWGLATRLRLDTTTSLVPLVLVTAHEDAPREVPVAVQGHVRKPFTRRQLLETIRRALGQGRP